MDGLDNLIGELADLAQSSTREQFMDGATPIVRDFVWQYASEQISYELRDAD